MLARVDCWLDVLEKVTSALETAIWCMVVWRTMQQAPRWLLYSEEEMWQGVLELLVAEGQRLRDQE
jgi:hypothetical protein